MSILQNLPHRATIRRRTRTKGDLGGSKDAPTVEQTDVKCWEQEAGHPESDEFQKQGISNVVRIYFTSNPNVRRRHQILITSRNGTAVTSPVPLDVLSTPIPDASVGRAIVWKIMAGINPARDD